MNLTDLRRAHEHHRNEIARQARMGNAEKAQASYERCLELTDELASRGCPVGPDFLPVAP